jgi:ketosteroid isomerase-like protein
MNTKETIQKYLDSIHNGFESLVTDEAKFTSFTSPVRSVAGKAAYVAATRNFYSKVASFEVRDLIVDANRACALTRYEVRGKDGGTFTSDVAEVFTVKDGKVDSLAIYFDLTPYPR